jgi:hypothetical protein
MDKRKYLQAGSVDRAHIKLTEILVRYPLPEVQRYAARLEKAAAEIKAYDAAQKEAKGALRAAGALTDRARDDIRREHLKPIARRARGFFKQDPTVMQAAVLPHTHDTLEAHANAALALAKALAPYVKACHEEGSPKNFLRDLRAAAKKVRAVAKRGDAAREQRGSATRSLTRLVRRAREDVQTIESLLEAEEVRRRGDPVFHTLVNEWRNASRVGKRKGRPRERGKQKPTSDDETS